MRLKRIIKFRNFRMKHWANGKFTNFLPIVKYANKQPINELFLSNSSVVDGCCSVYVNMTILHTFRLIIMQFRLIVTMGSNFSIWYKHNCVNLNWAINISNFNLRHTTSPSSLIRLGDRRFELTWKIKEKID